MRRKADRVLGWRLLQVAAVTVVVLRACVLTAVRRRSRLEVGGRPC